tara:strand:+ start:75 stop:329 length:255 start_codon:yes stop_codon:yes gene_type:complete
MVVELVPKPCPPGVLDKLDTAKVAPPEVRDTAVAAFIPVICTALFCSVLTSPVLSVKVNAFGVVSEEPDDVPLRATYLYPPPGG